MIQKNKNEIKNEDEVNAVIKVRLTIPQALEHIRPGVEAVVNSLPANLNGEIVARYSEQPGVCAQITVQGGEVSFHRPCELFRGIGLVAAGLRQGEASGIIRQDMPFETLGVMYDCSRNSVPTVAALKKILVKMALMGYNNFMLYTEETYTVASRPEFGHFRGRYSPEELRAVDDFAYQLGIELIPCVQALAHLERFLRWPSTESIKDTDIILLSGDAKVNELIEEMITSIASCVRSKRVHLGLDEAHGLGLGRYLVRNGYRKPEAILEEHLRVVRDICVKHGLRPMMWGDMIFRMHIEGSGYYDPDIELPAGTGDIIPKEYQQIYWDYYHTDEAFYDKYIREHLKQGIKPLFAAGIASWVGMVPNLLRTAVTTAQGVRAAKQHNLDEMFLCVWKDDGGEALPGPDYLGMLQYAENCYGAEGASEADLRRNAPIMTGAPYEHFLAVGSIDELQQGLSLVGLEAPNPHKYFLWQDVLLGQFDVEAAQGDFSALYRAKAEELEGLIAAGGYEPDAAYGLQLGVHLCRALVHKVDMGIRLKAAYDRADRAALQALREELAGPYTQAIEALYQCHRKGWGYFYKPFGWEVADLKYGYLLIRARTACSRIDAYLAGEIDRIDELEEQRLTCFGHLPQGVVGLPHHNSFARSATVSQLA